MSNTDVAPVDEAAVVVDEFAGSRVDDMGQTFVSTYEVFLDCLKNQSDMHAKR